MLWFNFILGLNFISLCFRVYMVMYDNESKIQKEIKFKPQHIYIYIYIFR